MEPASIEARPPATRRDVAPELLEALLESSADAFYLVDREGRVRFANPAAVALLGYDAEDELLGAPSHATIHHTRPDGSPFPAEECPLLRPRTTGETVRVDLDWFVRRDGTLVPVAYSSAPLDAHDVRAGAVVVFHEADPDRPRGDGGPSTEVGDLQRSRARIVAAADAARRRLSRDLHDGAQQRLVYVLMSLTSAAQRAGSGAGVDVGALLQRAASEVRGAISELRDLVAGVHPSLLTDRGLRAAIEAMATGAPIPVEVDVPRRRWPTGVEATAYFVVSEALTNVAKHAAGATHATVRARGADGGLVVEVADDGPGGATVDGGADGGTGLQGLADRVAAIGGTLSVTDVPGGGTRIAARLPLAAPAAAGLPAGAA